MKKILKNLLRILLYSAVSTTIVFFIFDNMYMADDMSVASDYMKNGSISSVYKLSKQYDDEMKNSIKIEEDKNKEKNTIEQSKDDKEEQAKENKNDTTKENSEKNYKTVDEIALDYPMGTTYYTLSIARGEMQIEILCVSMAYGIILGVNVFMFKTEEELKLKKLFIYLLINIIVSIVATEIIQLIAIYMIYGKVIVIAFNTQYVLISIAIFLFSFGFYKGKKDIKEKKSIQEQELKEKIVQTLTKNKNKKN